MCDFNLSRVMEESAVLSSMAATNPRWLAPEILAGRGYTFSSDVYSFGIILWEFLTWRVPWHEYGPWQVCMPCLSLGVEWTNALTLHRFCMLVYPHGKPDKILAHSHVPALSDLIRHDPGTAMQVVAMVTDGHQRPEIPQEDLGPSSSFPGMGEYVKLMHNCWEQVNAPPACTWHLLLL